MNVSEKICCAFRLKIKISTSVVRTFCRASTIFELFVCILQKSDFQYNTKINWIYFISTCNSMPVSINHSRFVQIFFFILNYALTVFNNQTITNHMWSTDDWIEIDFLWTVRVWFIWTKISPIDVHHCISHPFIANQPKFCNRKKKLWKHNWNFPFPFSFSWTFFL